MTDSRHVRAPGAGRTETIVPEPRFAALWATLVYTIATLTLGFPALAGRFLVTTHSDQYIAGYAFREFAAESLRSGNGFPLWNPFLQGGMPYVAAMHGDIFYPTFLLRTFLPTDVAMTWGFVLHVILAGLFTYGFLRAAGLSFYAALVGGLAYLMSGPISGYVSPGHDGKLFVSALLPLACWFLTIGMRTGRTWTWGALALVTGLAVLSPHPQLLQYMLLAAGSYALWLALGRHGDGTSLPRPLAMRRLGFALGAVLLGFAMGAVQYLPVQEYVPWSPRAGGTGWDHAVSYSMPLEELVSTYVPQFSGILDAYWGRNIIHFHSEYFGAAALFLAVAGAFWSDRSGGKGFSRFWLGTFVVSLLWTLGGSTPFYRLVYAIVPGTTYFRAPSTMMYVTMFAVAVLAALGTERLLGGHLSRRYIVGWATAAALVALLATAGALTNIAVGIANGYPVPPEYVQRSVEGASANHGALVLGAWRSLIFVLAAAGIAWAIGLRRLTPRAAGMLLVLVLTADYWSVLRNYWQFVESADVVYAADPTIEAMQQESEPYRVLPMALAQRFGLPGAVFRDPFLDGDALMSHDVPNVVGYHGNELGRYQQLVGNPKGADLLSNVALRTMLNVRYLLTDVGPAESLDPSTPDVTLPMIIPGAQHVVGPVRNAAGSEVHLYRFSDGAEAAWVTPAIVKAPDDGVLATVRDPRFDSTVRRRVALFDTSAAVTAQPADLPLPEPSAIRATVRRISPSHLRVQLSDPVAEGSALVVSENYYPGWKATVQGRDVPVHRANYTLIGVPLPAGASTVDLEFGSAPYETGKLVTLLAIAAALALTVFGVSRGRAAAGV
ncbi:MAG: YfhO family protein [Gemmatimonadaceae bacterium]|nr:YfhO family protein [Gemmatimonadaceae bacterium]